MAEAPIIVWYRQDLRIADHPALAAALATKAPVVPVFVWAPEEAAPWEPGGASRWWLHHSLTKLSAAWEALGAPLVVKRGPSAAALLEVAKAAGAQAVHYHWTVEPELRSRDARVTGELEAAGLTVRSFNGNWLAAPTALRTGAGKHFQVFTAFWRSFLANVDVDAPMPAPKVVPSLATRDAIAKLSSVSVDDLGLLPEIPWYKGLETTWTPGEQSAAATAKAFVKDGLEAYDVARDRPAVAGTSRLSPHLHFGEISPRQVWLLLTRVTDAASRGTFKLTAKARTALETFRKELIWREFAAHLLWHSPETTTEPLRREFASFPWEDDPAGLSAWQRGRTGYPIVDAGMRELWTTGTMHNRVRMIAGSFLVKDLLIPWQTGSRWFWDTLVDADLAANTMNWQWVAGSGADASPYFRIFNPVLQGEKFDPEGDYVRRWVPELAGLPKKFIHKPWDAPRAALDAAGVSLGETYPERVVDHAKARFAALKAYDRLKGKAVKRAAPAS
jgi:deoxyribodipyrimidine photo-lyase